MRGPSGRLINLPPVVAAMHASTVFHALCWYQQALAAHQLMTVKLPRSFC